MLQESKFHNNTMTYLLFINVINFSSFLTASEIPPTLATIQLSGNPGQLRLCH